MAVYRYHEGYQQARETAMSGTMEENLSYIDELFGRDNLSFGDGPQEVKQELLRQLEIEFRESVDEDATFWANVAKAQRNTLS